MISAIILSICGVKPEDIVEDYSLSANVYAEMNDHKAMVGAYSRRADWRSHTMYKSRSVSEDTLLAEVSSSQCWTRLGWARQRPYCSQATLEEIQPTPWIESEAKTMW